MSNVLQPSNAFDFEIGSWRVKHRRLRQRLANSSEWETFEGISTMRTVLGGAGNIEDNVIDLPSGTIKAIALRSYDAVSRSWAIWWLSSSNPHRLDTPLVGQFVDGVGRFYADDVLRGDPVKVRFLWLQTDTETPRWEQAMSADGGRSWETNWIMEFSRA